MVSSRALRRVPVCFALLVSFATLLPGVRAQEPAPYRSPYRVEFRESTRSLIGDLIEGERGDPRMESSVPFPEWYSPSVLRQWHSWGPPARRYPPPAGHESWSVERRRERVIAVALRYLGYGYQHHHVPDWSPPPAWPWKKTCVGSNGRGVDCSNFTAFVYNQGLGLRVSGDVHRQAEEREAVGPGAERRTRVERVELPSSYEERRRALRTGDLLFIRSRGGEISHVVLWLGHVGVSPDGTPLIVDSHGEDVRDSDGKPIPCGIQLRPFRENSWYNHSASHALRLIH